MRNKNPLTSCIDILVVLSQEVVVKQQTASLIQTRDILVCSHKPYLWTSGIILWTLWQHFSFSKDKVFLRFHCQDTLSDVLRYAYMAKNAIGSNYGIGESSSYDQKIVHHLF